MLTLSISSWSPVTWIVVYSLYYQNSLKTNNSIKILDSPPSILAMVVAEAMLLCQTEERDT
jgi:hypothetical protein